MISPVKNAKFLRNTDVFFKAIAKYFKHTKDKNFKKCWTLTRLGVQKHHKKLIGDGIDEKSKHFFKRNYHR